MKTTKLSHEQLRQRSYFMDSEDNEVISWIMKATKLSMNNEDNEVIRE